MVTTRRSATVVVTRTLDGTVIRRKTATTRVIVQPVITAVANREAYQEALKLADYDVYRLRIKSDGSVLVANNHTAFR